MEPVASVTDPRSMSPTIFQPDTRRRACASARLRELARLDVRDNALTALVRQWNAKLLLRGNGHAATIEGADRRWSLGELQQTAAEMASCPHVHDPRLPLVVERLAHELERSAIVVPTLPTLEMLAKAVRGFEKSLDEIAATDVAIAVELEDRPVDAAFGSANAAWAWQEPNRLDRGRVRSVSKPTVGRLGLFVQPQGVLASRRQPAAQHTSRPCRVRQAC